MPASTVPASPSATVVDYPGAAPPPPGVTPNLENPTDQGHTVNIVGLSVCISFATAFYFIRGYVKLRITRKIFLEDVMCLVSWVLLVLYTATVFMMSRHGEGYHTWDISPRDFSELLRWLYASSLVYTFGAFFTKVTLLLLIARVFTIRTGVTRGIHLFIVFLIVAYIPIQVLKIRICTPIRAYWNTAVHGRCLDQRKLFLSDISLAIISDIVILVIPIPLTWGMTAPWKKKLKIMMLLGAGGAATGVTIYRMVKAIEFIDSDDVAADFVALDMLTIAELTIGLMCSCFPSANIFIEHFKAPKSSPNTPRSRHSPGHSPGRSRLTWGGLGTTLGDTVDEETPTSATKTTSSSDQPSVLDRALQPAVIKNHESADQGLELAVHHEGYPPYTQDSTVNLADSPRHARKNTGV